MGLRMSDAHAIDGCLRAAGSSGGESLMDASIKIASGACIHWVFRKKPSETL
ncbi:hypothetical protein [Acidovorax sp. SDU_ACID1]|uniref:hypothetical protein n=1 Tax=Acidovorax sp. SDU_ACID1 TaxID=3136632 RepID=UPI003873B3F6